MGSINNTKWVKDDEMYVEKCSLFNEESDKKTELIQSLIVYSKYYNIRGGYKRLNESI